jgi:hypothetical protein
VEEAQDTDDRDRPNAEGDAHISTHAESIGSRAARVQSPA